MENTHILSIDRNSWHYRYYVNINALWGFHISRHSDRTSICPYCQKMLWFTVLAIILAFPAFVGFTLLLLSRLFYNFVYQSELLERYWECDLDNWHDYPHAVSRTSVYGNLVWYGVASTLLFIVVAFIGTLLFAICYNYLLIGYYFVRALAVVYSVILRIGWILFHLPAGAWFVGVSICDFIVYLWSGTSLFSCAYWIGIVLGVACLGWIGIAVMQEFMFYLERQSAIKKEKREQEEQSVIQLPPREPTWLDKAWNKIWNSIYYFFVSKEEVIDGKVHKVLSPMAIVWRFLVAIKHQICPIVEFVDSKDQTSLTS